MRAAVAALVLMFSLAFAACDDDAPATSTSPSPAATAEPRTVSGLFTEPRTRAPDEVRSLGPTPASPFSEPNPANTTIFDTRTGAQMDLGAGLVGQFSPDSTRMAWMALGAGSAPFSSTDEARAMVLDLHTEQRLEVGEGRLVVFKDNDTLTIVLAGSNESYEYDLRTGVRTDGAEFPPTSDPYYVREQAFGYSIGVSSSSPTPSRYTVRDRATGAVLLSLPGVYYATPADERTIVVTTEPVPTEDPDAAGYARSTANYFLVDIATGAATFIATGTARYGEFTPVGNERYVIWTDSYCGDPQGKTRIYDRRTQRIMQIDRSLYATLTPTGLIGDGAFGADALIDPETLTYVAVLPQTIDNTWSPDYRYASSGQSGGHGGVCP